MSEKILITGIGGFLGHHCLKYFLDHTDYNIIGLDSFVHKGTCQRIETVTVPNPRVKIFKHDLTVPIDRQLENLLLDRKIDKAGNIVEDRIDAIINIASDSAVERSISNPSLCWKNNCDLMLTILEFARIAKPKIFIQVSSDEVYGEAKPLPSKGHEEWSTIMPSNPYAASKAAQEALCISYFRSYDIPIVITNCMNLIGECQDPEKFIPKIIQCVAQGHTVPIYGDADQSGSHTDSNGVRWNIGSRVYLDALNKADALVFLTKQKVSKYSQGFKSPDRYNICGTESLDNLEIAVLISNIMQKQLNYKLVACESARAGYDRRYALDGSKLASKGWVAPIPFDSTILRIVNSSLKNAQWII